MSALSADERLVRLVMAELVRQCLDAEGEGEAAARLVKVTGFRERELVRYEGTSSEWAEGYVDIFWDDDGQGSQTYEFRGTMQEATAAMERLIENY